MPEPPILLAKWYDYAKWIIERVDSFPKNQRFIFGQRLAGHALDIMELLVEAAYARDKAALLHTANPQDRDAALAGPHGQGPGAFHRAAV